MIRLLERTPGSERFRYALIIKVASIPKERIQVYFIDNDEYFKRKANVY